MARAMNNGSAPNEAELMLLPLIERDNTTDLAAWSVEARRLLRVFRSSGDARHQLALLRHLAGVGLRIVFGAETKGINVSAITNTLPVLTVERQRELQERRRLALMDVRAAH